MTEQPEPAPAQKDKIEEIAEEAAENEESRAAPQEQDDSLT